MQRHIAAIAALCCLGALGAQAQQLEQLSARVKFIRGAILIENRNDWAWKACSFTINPDDLEYAYTYFRSGVTVQAHEALAIRVGDFNFAGREAYNPTKHPPHVLRLVCDTPSTGRASLETAIE